MLGNEAATDLPQLRQRDVPQRLPAGIAACVPHDGVELVESGFSPFQGVPLVFTAVLYRLSLLNSTLVATLQTTGQLLLCSLAGYGLARIPYRRSNKVLYL